MTIRSVSENKVYSYSQRENKSTTGSLKSMCNGRNNGIVAKIALIFCPIDNFGSWAVLTLETRCVSRIGRTVTKVKTARNSVTHCVHGQDLYGTM